MIYPVYRGSEVIFNLDAESGSTQETVLNGVDICRLRFTMPNVVDIQIKDYILVDGKKYSFNTIPDFTKTSERKYTYDCTVESIQYELGKVLFQDGNGISDFFLTGDLTFFITHLVTNLNRVGTGWTVGTVKDSTETLNLQFSNESCLAVLQRLCGQYLVNFKITDEKVISVDNFTQSNIPTFSYGEGKGLYELTRTVVTSKNHITRLYCYGGDKNIPANYRNYSTRLKIPTGYIDKNVDKYGVIEGSISLDEIYPRFKGTVTQVIDDFTYRCSAIDFDLNAQKMPGVNMKIRFNSGQLAGYEFELATYTHSTKEFKINTNDQEKAVNVSGALEQFKLPNTLIKAGLGDRFVFVDIIMPQTYIDNAEAELLVKANEYLNQNCDPRAQHDLKIDPLYIRYSGIVLNAGDYINIKDTYLNIDKNDLILSRIKDLFKIGKIDIKLSDSVAPQVLNRNVAALEDIKRVIIRNQLGDIYRTNRGLKSMDEAFKMYFDSDGYLDEDRIRPLSIQTGMLAVGGKASQFSLSCVIEPMYQGYLGRVKLGAGTLVHFAIEETIRMWTMSESISQLLVDSTAYYIYARCLRAGTTGALVIDTVQRKVDSDPTNYYFLVGIVNSVVDNMRLISLMYGVTTIVGGQIKTGTIASPDGLTFFDIQNGIFQGIFKFRSGTEGIENALEIGNRNLIRNSVFKTNLNYWYRGGNHTISIDTVNTYQGYNSLKIVSTGVGDNNNRVYTPAINIVNNKDHVISFYAKADANVTLNANIGNGLEFAITIAWKFYWCKVKGSTYQNLRLYLTTAGTAYVTMVKLEQGTIPSGWGPAPEDIANELSESYNYVNAIKADLQTQIDGQIMSWFELHDPTLTNYPANQWTTVDLKNKHLGDLFYRNDTGVGWRFSQLYGNYSWTEINDTDITAALAAAAAAQDTADGKRRVFVSQPVPPYDIGDLWAQGPDGDLLKCNVAKPEGGLYSLSDWGPVSKYTDDTVANEALSEVEKTRLLAIGKGYAAGNMLHTDPSFTRGYNEVKKYDSNNSPDVTLTRINKGSIDSPIIDSDYLIHLRVTGLGANVGFGGFYFGDESRSGAMFITRFIAQLPVGRTFEFATFRAIGNSPILTWATSNQGTGKFEEYIYVAQCGIGGSFVSTNFFYINGGEPYPTPETPLDCYIAWASTYDMTSAINSHTFARTKAQNFTSQPVPPYWVNDTWQDGTSLRTCVIERLSGAYVAGDWAVRVAYDNTETTINGGLLTTGRIGLKDANGVEWAGIRGATGVDGTEVAAWFGASFANRNVAPWRAYHNGEAFMGGWTVKKDPATGVFVFLKDTGVDATSAGMSPTDYVFFAGATYANRANAKYYVKPNGDAKMTRAYLSSNPTGKRIVIDSADNTLTLYNATDKYIKLDADIGADNVKLSIGNNNVYRTDILGYSMTIASYTNPVKAVVLDALNGGRTWTKVQVIGMPIHWQVDPEEQGAVWKVLYVNKNTGTIAMAG
jgi:hypothetical protein